MSRPICDECGEPIVVRFGPYSTFWGCTAFSRSRNTKPRKAGYAHRGEDVYWVPEHGFCSQCGAQERPYCGACRCG
ncbi:MAG: hypothetical protein KatS3mg102_0718 [Planctomycetota bacterium]|nr:MAG: hypothetical protein KatS3mg102_0718 [Planctomycetota bacterium]